jgi:hypothetical protein
MITFVLNVLAAAVFNAESTWRSRQILTLKKLGSSCEGRSGFERDALTHNSAPKVNTIFNGCRVAGMIATSVWQS